LLFLALGGSDEIGMNANLYGCQGKWIMVDLGVTFGNSDYPGIDLVFPDLEFIEDRKKDLLGIILTHAHEDHIGAVPYFAAELGVPLYATRFTAEMIRRKLEEEGIEEQVELNILPMEAEFALGVFKCKFVTLAHSIPEMSAVLIDTPHGKVFHTGDWKLDEEPVIGTPSSAEQIWKSHRQIGRARHGVRFDQCVQCLKLQAAKAACGRICSNRWWRPRAAWW
jgi:ribonuclease J